MKQEHEDYLYRVRRNEFIAVVMIVWSVVGFIALAWLGCGG